jgi:FixJ family two-component response regulator
MNDLPEVQASREKLHIAIVDDDSELRKALHRLFRSAGFEIETFASGEEFIRTLQAREPDCLLLDLHMPGMNGWDVQRQLTTMGSEFPVIVFTGRDQPGLPERVLATGVAAFLLKPVDGNELIRIVHNLLKK